MVDDTKDDTTEFAYHQTIKVANDDNNDLTSNQNQYAEPRSESTEQTQQKKTKSLCCKVVILITFLFFICSIVTLSDDNCYLWLINTCRHLGIIDETFIKSLASRAFGIEHRTRRFYRLKKMYLSELDKRGVSFERGSTLYELSLFALLGLDSVANAKAYANEAIRNQLALRGPRDPCLVYPYSVLATAFHREAQDLSARGYSHKCGKVIYIAADPDSPMYKKFPLWKNLLDSNRAISENHDILYLGYIFSVPDWKVCDFSSSQSTVPYQHLLKAFRAESGEPQYNRQEEYELAVKTSVKNQGANSPHTATYMNDYACFLRSKGRVAEAVEWEKKCDAIRAKQPKPPWLDESIPLDEAPQK